MSSECKIYVRLVEGTYCLWAVAAHENPDGTFRLLANPDFDPEDTSTLFEFLPGDDVRASLRDPGEFPGETPLLTATELVRSSADDREYWAVLFSIASGGESPPSIDADRLAVIAVRVRSELEKRTRWHYPSVREWANTLG